MTVEEAVLEVTGSKSEFLVFRNAESNRVSVVYRRKDGNFGLIEP
jgi:ribosome hibernation promoting factor